MVKNMTSNEKDEALMNLLYGVLRRGGEPCVTLALEAWFAREKGEIERAFMLVYAALDASRAEIIPKEPAPNSAWKILERVGVIKAEGCNT